MADSLEHLARDLGVEIGPVAPAAVVREVKPFEGSVTGEVDDEVVEWLSGEGLITGMDGDWLTIVCPNGEAHTTGDTTARYSPLGCGDDTYKMTRGFKCFHEHCSDIDFLGWVAGAGGPVCRRYDPLPWLQRQYVYVAERRRVCDLGALRSGSRHDLALEEFGDLHGHIRVSMPTSRDAKRTVSCKNAFLEDVNTVKAAQYVVRPYVSGEAGCGEVEVSNGGLVVNTYRPPVHDAAIASGVDLFLDHLRYLLPIPGEYEAVLDCLAFKLQNPRRRAWGIVMVAEGAFGVGRSWFGDVLRGVWGPRLVASIDIGDLTGTGASAGFNEWASGSQLVVVSEAHDGAARRQYNAYEHIKTLVDTRVTAMQINRKYGGKGTEDVYFNLLVFTNHADALTVPPRERRLAVFDNPREEKSAEYYNTLWSAYRDNGAELFAAVHEMLMTRDVSRFNPAVAPDTEAKRTMLDMSLGPADILSRSVIERCVGELVTHDMLYDLVNEAERLERLEGTLTNNAKRGVVERLWRQLGGLCPGSHNGVRYTEGEGRFEVRALRNQKEWISVFEAADKGRKRRMLMENISKSRRGLK